MQAKYSKKFNHDPWANAYDEDVADESNPIRAGYGAVLDFVAARCPQFPGAKILDIGIGTGNLTMRLNSKVQVVGIDISNKMMALARQKLAPTHSVNFIVADMLALTTLQKLGLETTAHQFSDLSWVITAEKKILT